MGAAILLGYMAAYGFDIECADGRIVKSIIIIIIF